MSSVGTAYGTPSAIVASSSVAGVEARSETRTPMVGAELAGVNVTVTSTVLAEAELLANVAPPRPVKPSPPRSVAYVVLPTVYVATSESCTPTAHSVPAAIESAGVGTEST